MSCGIGWVPEPGAWAGLFSVQGVAQARFSRSPSCGFPPAAPGSKDCRTLGCLDTYVGCYLVSR